MTRLFIWSRKYPVIAILIIAVLSTFAALNISKLELDSSSDTMMMKNDPDLDYYNETMDIFGSDTMLILFVHDNELFTIDKLFQLEELVIAVDGIPGVFRVESLFSVGNISGEFGYVDSSPLMEWVPEFQDEANEVKEKALNNPILVNSLISEDGTSTSINLYLEPDISPEITEELTATVRDIVAGHEDSFDELFEIGLPYTQNEIARYIRQDMFRLIPMAFGVLLIMLTITMGSVSAAVLPTLTSGFSIYFTLGFMAFVGIPINLLTFIVPILVVVIGSTEDVHILSEYDEGIHKHHDRNFAINFMARTIGTAILLTSLTTFLGFMSVSINRIIVLRQFGIAAGFALFINPLTTVLISPAYLRTFGKKKVKERKSGFVHRGLLNISGKLHNLIVYRKVLTLTILIGIAIVLGLFSTQIYVDNDSVSFFKSASPIPKRMNRIHEAIAGAQNFNIRISSGQESGFTNPEYLHQVEELIEKLEEDYPFDKIISINDYLKLTHREMYYGDTEYFAVPEDSDLIAQYSLFMGDEDPKSYVSFDWSEINIIVRHNISSSDRLNTLVGQIYDDMDETLDPYLKYQITGKKVLINKAANTIARSQVQGIGLLLVAILIIMTILFTDIKAGLLSLIPNMFPVAIFMGIMGLFQIPLNIGTCMVAAIAIGISVDDTIHFMARYNKEMRNYPDKRQAIKVVLDSEIQPVVSTSFALMLGFGILMFANLTPILYFGLLSAIVMACALIADLLVTPILLTSFA